MMRLTIVFFSSLLLLVATPLYADKTLKDSLNTLSSSGTLHAAFSTQRFYDTTTSGFVWNEFMLAELNQAIEQSETHGLMPSDYHQRDLLADHLSHAERDILATDAYLSLAGHLLGGKLNPVSMEPTWTVKGRERDLVDYLKSSLQDKSIAYSLEQLAPQQTSYRALRDSLSVYQSMTVADELEEIPAGVLLKPSMRGLRVIQLRRRIHLIENSKTTDESELYDELLIYAVKRFQKSNNLEPDGVVGTATLAALNRSQQDRINQIRVNLERWRWLPDDLGPRHIIVNIANYQLNANGSDNNSQQYEVVIGKTYRQTPVFSATMSYVVLNPWWETPNKLAREDLLPKFQKDPNVVSKLGYQIIDNTGIILNNEEIDWSKYSSKHFPFRVRQQPGTQNAMGQVKLIFPNKHDVYLHDTPARELFNKTRRDFSSGCIRVKNPIDLVQWALKNNPEGSREKINELLESGKETIINLKSRIPVHLIYLTVIADTEAQSIRFIDDIYARDGRVLNALNIPPEHIMNQ
jgi:murein L,D-transpeptidase YcbB/YkuD